MKKVLGLAAVLLVVSFSGVAVAGTWDAKCNMCHKDGNTMKAPTKAALQEKYKTPDGFIKAAKASKSPMMKNSQKEEILKAAAKDLYK
ncbi:MAG: hypothetical protein A2X56_13495 [Nitrospirae bacterium GWC2_57_13]|jgi:hypothetical protein|nr:MAG: hypothetical protein A2X56_13495 [Nitrospirae bacterium GWC2_57_13]HAR44417.1 hypothetical protein [Bdellovibrionales bacterium]HAS53650.1 hypothetical protein [Nitrospiraceae bacterium]